MSEYQTRNDLKSFLHSALVALLAGGPLVVVPVTQVAPRPGAMTFDPGLWEQRGQQPPRVQYAMRPTDPKWRGAQGTCKRQEELAAEG
jgi:hypothetical protein